MVGVVALAAVYYAAGRASLALQYDGPVAAIYRRIARRCAVKIAESQRDMTSKFPNIVVQNT